MKKLLLFLFLIPTLSYSQDYSEVVKVPGKNVDQLYSSAKEWFAESFKSANDVLQLDDKPAGKLIGKGVMQIPVKYNSAFVTTPIILHATFTIKVSVRDSMYKYDIGAISINSGGPHSLNEYKNASDPENAKQMLITQGGMRNPSKSLIKKTTDFNSSIYECANAEFIKIVESLKAKMSSSDTW